MYYWYYTTIGIISRCVGCRPTLVYDHIKHITGNFVHIKTSKYNKNVSIVLTVTSLSMWHWPVANCILKPPPTRHTTSAYSSSSPPTASTGTAQRRIYDWEIFNLNWCTNDLKISLSSRISLSKNTNQKCYVKTTCYVWFTIGSLSVGLLMEFLNILKL